MLRIYQRRATAALAPLGGFPASTVTALQRDAETPAEFKQLRSAEDAGHLSSHLTPRSCPDKFCALNSPPAPPSQLEPPKVLSEGTSGGLVGRLGGPGDADEQGLPPAWGTLLHLPGMPPPPPTPSRGDPCHALDV